MSSNKRNQDDSGDREVVDRRSGLDRRAMAESGAGKDLDRRRGPGRRLSARPVVEKKPTDLWGVCVV